MNKLKDLQAQKKTPKINCIKCGKLKELIELNLILGCYVCDECTDNIETEKREEEK